MSLIDWGSIRDVKSLMASLESFIIRVFGEDYIKDQFSKLKAKPKGVPERLQYVVEPNVHRVAGWWNIIQSFKEHGYSFDLRFSANVEEFMDLMLFSYAFNLLLGSKVVAIDDSRVLGRLKDRDNFSSLVYETLIASNYVSNGFHVEVPDLVSTVDRKPDIFAKKGDLEVYGECKNLERNERYSEIAVELSSWLYDNRVNCILDITLPHTPRREDKDYVRKIMELARSARFIRPWLEQHPMIDAIVLTVPKVYVDPMGIPYAIALEQKSISSYVAPGWTIVVPIIPVPQDTAQKTL
jgi:hypothetical protein